MDKIFINIAAYRDPLLIRTLKQAYEKAHNPESLVFALGMQYEEAIYPDLSFIPKDQIHAIKYDIPSRPGVARIRYEITQSAFSNEKYFLMIDSHMTFQNGWDTWLKESLNNLGPKSIISGLGEIHDGHITISNCEVIQGHTELALNRVENRIPIKPEEHGSFFKFPYIACGFMFTYGSFVYDVGFDEYSQADGEEIYLTWRAFMCGWDVYQTSKWVINHSPEIYFDIAWGGEDKRSYTRYGTEARFKPYMNMLRSIAYVYNDMSMYAVKNATRKPEEWFIACGYTKSDYQTILRYYDNLIHNNLTERDILII